MPLHREIAVEVAPVLGELRENRPVCPITLVTGAPAMLVTRHEDIKTILSDRRFSRAAVCKEDAPKTTLVPPNPDTLVNMDPPRHGSIRRIAAQAFTPKRLERLMPRIGEIAADLVDAMVAAGKPVDLNEMFSRPLPLRVICDMLGVPFADWALFHEWTEVILNVHASPQDIGAAYVAMRAYFVNLITTKRDDPGDDFLSELGTASAEGGPLTEQEAIAVATFVFVAGHETSATLLTAGVLSLLRHPDQLKELLADPELWVGAADEINRVGIPGLSPFPRIALTDLTLQDVEIPAGTAVVANYEAGLRDPRVYPEPEKFDIHRRHPNPLWFGHGPHFCLGAPVARAELYLGLRELFERLPTLALDMPIDDLKWRNTATLGGFEQFPVTW
ncbi:cytochrome P450 [Actinophytocola oryzae]|uniref:Cytochrome P450 n=1 Tax=Actinophytocola oryzae TaxID=502181 RepID=A0A4R7W4F6_9PSEU|nr:cytochrome P450 [Actinophytocola oryzae]TDV57583.1 cytochrome P450 [Actinophytocola oryzae]